MKYAYTLTDRTLSAIVGGRVYQTDRSNPGWSRIKELLSDDTTDDAELIALFAPIQGIVSRTKEITVENGMVLWGGDPIHSALQRRMVDVMNEGLDIEPWIKFATNVYDNPSPLARTELYEFLELSDCPITPDGCFLAYKGVNDDYTDCYSGQFDNSVGQFVSMAREAVDPIRDHLCSTGLHFCSKAYLPSTPGSKTVLLKINPRDVVSIPSDYNQSKGRTCAYEVVGEITADLARTIVWNPIQASHGRHKWGYDPADDHVELDEVVEPETPLVEFVMSVSHGKITRKKFEKMLKKYGSLSGMARNLGMSAGTIQQWRRKLIP